MVHRKFKGSPVVFILISLIILSNPQATWGADPNSQKKEIEKIENELSKEKEQYMKFGKEEEGLIGKLSDIDRDTEARRETLRNLRQNINQKKGELEVKKKELDGLGAKTKETRERLAKRIVSFYKYTKRGYIQIFANAKDLHEIRKGLHGLRAVMNEDSRLIQEMAKTKQRHDQEISAIAERIGAIQGMEEEEKEQLQSIKEDRERKILVLMKIHQEKEFYETAVRELELAAANLRETLQKLDGIQDNQASLPSGFEDAKGKLPLPFNGKITSDENLFGVKTHLGNKGIYIEGPLGAKVRAIFPGRVDFSGLVKGYGQLIVINHGSRFFTVSAHLSERYKEEGAIVEGGEVIGLVGQTDLLKGPRIYFEMRKAGTPVDPLKWLKVR